MDEQLYALRYKKVDERTIARKDNFRMFVQTIIKETKIPSGKKEGAFFPTYISGFDSLLEKGGIAPGENILLIGTVGTGKTTFCMQMLYEAAKRDENGVFITFSSTPEKVKEHVRDYPWFEETSRVQILSMSAKEFYDSFTRDRERAFATWGIDEKVRRVCIDQFSELEGVCKEHYPFFVRDLFISLSRQRTVNVFIIEKDPMNITLEEHYAQGILAFKQRGEDRFLQLEILKMECTPHARGEIPYSVTHDGIVVKYA